MLGVAELGVEGVPVLDPPVENRNADVDDG
jgi:hypothetical protein